MERKAKKKHKLSLTKSDTTNDIKGSENDATKNNPVGRRKRSVPKSTLRTSSSTANKNDGKLTNPAEKSPDRKKSRKKGPIRDDVSPAKFNRTITDWIGNPVREKSRETRCPVCKNDVLFADINRHLDEDCDLLCRIEVIEESGNASIHKEQHCTKKSLKSRSNRTTSKAIDLNKDNPDQEVVLVHSQRSKKKLNKDKVLSTSTNECAKSSDQFSSSNINQNIDKIDEVDICIHTTSKPVECNVECGRTRNIDCNNSTSCSINVLHDADDIISAPTCDDDDSNTATVSNPQGIDVPNESDDTTQEQDLHPYYLANFKLVLNTVLSNEEDQKLFNQADHEVIKHFQELSNEAQKLYIRLFQRKPGWFRCSKLDYPKIADDLKPVLDSLLEVGYLDGEKNLSDLKETLKLLPADNLKELAKVLHIGSKSTKNKGHSKQEVIEDFIKHGKSQRTLFGNGIALMLKRAKEVLGTCVCVSEEPKSVFLRVLLLFTMNIIPQDEENKFNGQTQQLSTLFLANIGKVVYQEYEILRQAKIFADRDHMIRFAQAYQEKHKMFNALEQTKNLETAYSFYPKAAASYKDVLTELQESRQKRTEMFSSSLPIHLRCFTAEWVYTKMCYLGVEVLQKQRCYQEAVEQLELLLQQDTYCADCRGKWWDRLALNVHQHLKQPIKALHIIRQGLEDSNVRFGKRLALVQRARKITSSASFIKANKNDQDCVIDESLLVEPKPVDTVTISGERSAEHAAFIHHEGDTKTVMAVEEFALLHYRKQGYDEGIHGETSTFTTLYGIFFWDIIFAGGIPDVFRGSFQDAPLDMNYDTFYENRKELIDKRLSEIQSCSTQELQETLEKSWTSHEGQICSPVSWERFCNVEQAMQLVSCLGGKVLCGVFEHFAKDLRHWHSGMPDLVVWNSSKLDCRIVEVKGPGDRLSTKQQIWLDELASFGATVEVCYVTAVGGKKLKAP